MYDIVDANRCNLVDVMQRTLLIVVVYFVQIILCVKWDQTLLCLPSNMCN